MSAASKGETHSRSGEARIARRTVLCAGALAGVGMTGLMQPALAQAENERPKEGDLLVSVEAETTVALGVGDIPSGGPQVLAWPMDPAGMIVRKGSRLNKVLLLRLDPATLTGVTGERSADGVVAYSAICPHAGCEISGWDATQKILECSCHFSHYNPREAAAVIDGPTPRAPAALPLKVANGKLVVAKSFTGRVGNAPT